MEKQTMTTRAERYVERWRKINHRAVIVSRIRRARRGYSMNRFYRLVKALADGYWCGLSDARCKRLEYLAGRSMLRTLTVHDIYVRGRCLADVFGVKAA